MKSFARVLAIAIVLAMALTLALAASAFATDSQANTGSSAGTLKFIKSTPEDGGENVPIDNVGVKLFFDGNVTDEAVWLANSKCFTLSDSEGKTVGYQAYPGQKAGEEGYILVLASPDPIKEGQPGQLMQKSDYSLKISGDLMSTAGARLGEEKIIRFQTMDVAANSKLSMIIMVLMMVAVIALMFVTNWRKMKAEAEAAALAKANPYRVAKDKNISVDEAKALIETAKEKNKKLLEKTGGKAPPPPEKKSAAPRLDSKKKKKKDTHKVKGPRPVSEGGSKFKTGRKAEKERKARAEAAKKAAKAQQKTGATGSKKNTKGKGKKK